MSTDIKEALTDDDVYASSLALTPEQIAESSWTGIGITDFGAVIATIYESQDHKGYFHCVVVGKTVSQTKRPVGARGVGITLDCLLTSDHHCNAGSLRWKREANPYKRHEAKTRKSPHDAIYFLRAGPFIKIGTTSTGTQKRISDLQTGCPYPIALIAQVQGGHQEERALHRQFATLRAHGEWFHATEQLLAHIESLTVTA